jgi:two-component system sensor histidine kinase CpxA
MRSLLVRFFLAFWLMIVATIGIAAALGFYYSERAHVAIERFELSDAMYDASTALKSNGREGLTEWLESLPGVTGSLIYVVDERRRDILDRQLPASISIALRRFDRRRGGHRDTRKFGNIRPARPFTELEGPDGTVYTFFALRPQGELGRWFNNRGFAGLALIAIAISAAISYLLAGTISRPVRQLRSAATAIASGDFDTRIAGPVLKRRDEIGLLARDFDRMASELQRSLHRQSELTQNVSHELRSPLARLRVALELARRKAGEISELDKIDLETERLDALIGQILEFSKLNSDSHEQRSKLNVVDVVQSIIDDVRFEYGQHKNVELRDAPDDEVFVSGYDGAMRSAIENIIRNAARHGQPGGHVYVDIDVESALVEISVQDDGGGVATDELEHLFEPFYRAKPNRAESSRSGSGLGLAIADRAIELHGGSLEARNNDDGLCVTIRLPREA